MAPTPKMQMRMGFSLLGRVAKIASPRVLLSSCRGIRETASAEVACGWQRFSGADPLAARAVDMKGSSGGFEPRRSPCDATGQRRTVHHRADGCHGHFLQRLT